MTDLEITKVEFFNNGMYIYWISSIGFGVYTLYTKDNKIYAETENMDNEHKDFTKMLFDRLINMIEVIE